MEKATAAWEATGRQRSFPPVADCSFLPQMDTDGHRHGGILSVKIREDLWLNPQSQSAMNFRRQKAQKAQNRSDFLDCNIGESFIFGRKLTG
jgi:hypothetical protein